MKNIAFDYQVFAMQTYGGVSRYYFELCSRLQNLSNQEMNGRIVAPIHVNEYIQKLPQSQIDYFLRVNRFPGAWRFLQPFNQMMSRYKMATNHTNLVHETFYCQQSVAPQNCPRVITVYDMLFEAQAKQSRAYQSMLQTKKKAIERADKVICISASTKRELIQYLSVPESKISTIHLGFELSSAVPSFSANTNTQVPINAETNHNHLTAKPFLLHVGYRAGYKNFTNLLKAYAASDYLKNTFDLVTFGPNPFTRDESLHIEGLKLSDHVRQVSGSDEKLIAHYQNAAAYILPSTYEGFGIPLLEAMQFGCPVLCSDTTSMPEVAGNAACYFDPHSIDSMRSVIESTMQSTHLKDQKIQLGFERVKQFSWNKCTLETINLYRQLL
ncbi:MAG TPA: glycosyltransferase family 1 protein [Burkholderiaceae bacterium]|nr:glycosyltransferase family 1 protein [Burkholderiaceae bacterium]